LVHDADLVKTVHQFIFPLTVVEVYARVLFALLFTTQIIFLGAPLTLPRSATVLVVGENLAELIFTYLVQIPFDTGADCDVGRTQERRVYPR